MHGLMVFGKKIENKYFALFSKLGTLVKIAVILYKSSNLQ